MKEFKNSLNGSGLKVAIAVARFNEVVTDRLLEGAVRELETLGVDSDNINSKRSASIAIISLWLMCRALLNCRASAADLWILASTMP